MSEAKYLPIVIQAAKERGLDPVMLAGQIAQESGWNPEAKSKAGAVGIAQFVPKTAKAMGLNPLDPVASINAAADYMVALKKRFGSEDLARLAYNWGEGNVSAYLKSGGKKSIPAEAAGYNEAIAKKAVKYGAVPAAAAVTPASSTAAVAARPAATAAPATSGFSDPSGATDGAAIMGASWVDALRAMQGGQVQPAAQPVEGGGFDIAQHLTDAASRNQDAVLSSMFSDTQKPALENTDFLPASIDRYIERVLS